MLVQTCEQQSELLEGVRKGNIQGTTIGDMKGDTRSLDYNHYNPLYNRTSI